MPRTGASGTEQGAGAADPRTGTAGDKQRPNATDWIIRDGSSSTSRRRPGWIIRGTKGGQTPQIGTSGLEQAAGATAEPGPNPAGRGAEPNVYIAHPTHRAGTRPNRTQPPTAARKTTLNAGQCVRQPREGRGRNRQPPPPPPKKEGGGEGGARKHPAAMKPPANTTRGGQTPHPEGTKDRTPKEAQGDHPAKTGNTKPGTAAQRESGHRNMQTHTTKKKRASSPAPKTGDGGTGTTRPGTGKPSNRHHKAKKKKKRKKHTPTTKPRKAGHSRDPGPARTPTPHTRTGNGGGPAERARNHTRPISRPKRKPNHEHHNQLAREGQHHKPCPNTPTQDPSQDWRG